MEYWEKIRILLTIFLVLGVVALCNVRWDELEGKGKDENVVVETHDKPVVEYPETREAALHGTPVSLVFGEEVYEIHPTREELAYGMRYSREP